MRPAGALRGADALRGPDASGAPRLACPPDTRLDHQLCFALYATSLTMTKLYKPLLAGLGLTYPQYVVMLALWEADRVSLKTLGERVSLDSGTLTPMLKRLEAAGYIARNRNPRDEREVLVSLSAAGRAARGKAAAIQKQAACATGLSAESGRRLMRALAGLREHLAAHLPEAAP